MSAWTESQAGFLSRRRFFRWASSIAAAVGVAPLISSAKTLSSPIASSAASSDTRIILLAGSGKNRTGMI